MTDRGRFAARPREPGTTADATRGEVSALELRPRAPTRSGKFLSQPASRRRSADNIPTVRAPPVQHVSGTLLSVPPLMAPPLELDLVPVIGGREAPGPSLATVAAGPPADDEQEARTRREALVRLSGFGSPPASWMGAPSYAVRVLVRQRVLAQNLAHARRYRLVDADVYEEAMSMADRPTVHVGITIIVVVAGLLVVACLVVGFLL